ncbi:MAG: DUF393 domain-containing protein [Bdellovibrionales bacterium]|nr:DUF393 domain-containing protein [Bdellovibrionales bacterium]
MAQTTIYFDGLCYLCSMEISHYRKMKGSANIRFVDITQSTFDPKTEGVDPVEVHKNMHVRDKEGTLRLGVDAFIAIWEELPALKFLVPIANTGPVNRVLRYGYSFFAKIRPLLPRKSCETSPFCDIQRKP